MKKFYNLLGLAMMLLSFQSCMLNDMSQDVDLATMLQENYLVVEGAEYCEGHLPSATTYDSIGDVDMNTEVIIGMMNYITVTTDKSIRKFLVSVKGMPGFWCYVPMKASSENGRNTYVIPAVMGDAFVGQSTVMLSGILGDGHIASRVEKNISIVSPTCGNTSNTQSYQR